ncbi:hypothetical protein IJO12_06165 [bacterium]|nr:hypothetical protein [bacterium]
MLKIQPGLPAFKADKNSLDNKGEYKDPLMKWPLRGAAFTNEIGESFRPVIGKFATLTWIPVFLYIGADVYDKYKNNETEYSPDSKRCLKQAIFQGLASIAIPLIFIKAGQKVFSQFGKLGKEKLSINDQEAVSNMAQSFIANGKMHAYHGKDIECEKEFVDRVKNVMDFLDHKQSGMKKARHFTEGYINNLFKYNREKHVENYSRKTINKLIDLRKNLLNPTEEFKKTFYYKDFLKAINSGQTENVAVKTILSNFQQDAVLKGKYLKTLGGLIAIAFAIKPIDNFVEHVLIGKYIEPTLDNMQLKKEKKQNKTFSLQENDVQEFIEMQNQDRNEVVG